MEYLHFGWLYNKEGYTKRAFPRAVVVLLLLTGWSSKPWFHKNVRRKHPHLNFILKFSLRH